MLLDENIRKEVTPKRVFSTLKLIKYKKYKSHELKELIQPKALSSLADEKGSIEFNKILSFLIKMGFVEQDVDGYVTCNLDKSVLESPEIFRKYFCSKAFEGDKSNQFYQFTSWYMAQDEEIFYQGKLENIITNNLEFESLGREFINAWRLWVSFMGLGFLHESQFIHNPYVRIQDCIDFYNDIKRNKRMPFKEFIDWLSLRCPELVRGITGNSLSYSVSSALRNLHDTGKIHLNIVQDSTDVWHLRKLDTHEIQQSVSEITVRE